MAQKRSSPSTLTKAENLRFGPPPTARDRRGQNPYSRQRLRQRIHSDPEILPEISVDQTRGTKRSATVAAQVDEPNEDKGEGEDSESRRKSVTPDGRRRVRFQFLPVSHSKKRPRVSDGLETEEAAPQEMWVAVGEVCPLQ
jgi:hypothetical protein